MNKWLAQEGVLDYQHFHRFMGTIPAENGGLRTNLPDDLSYPQKNVEKDLLVSTITF